MGVASLVLGIAALVLSIFGIGWLGALCGIIGIILGAVARKKNPENGLATGGLVCSVIGTVLAMIFWIACASCIAGIASLA